MPSVEDSLQAAIRAVAAEIAVMVQGEVARQIESMGQVGTPTTRARQGFVKPDGKPDSLLTVKEVAAITRLSPSTLNGWRTTGRDEIPYKWLGGRALYLESDVIQWIMQGDRRVYT